tara:strand:- start:548 stop:952 length:405 start_codon:yes stop_codon:yes gene_type:complete
MKLKNIFLSILVLFFVSCNTAVDNNAKISELEQKIDQLSQAFSDNDGKNTTSNSSNNGDMKKINARLNSLESSLKKLEKSFSDFSKNQKNNKKQPNKPSGPWKRDYTYKTSVGNSYFQGPEDAKVVITEWSDYF